MKPVFVILILTILGACAPPDNNNTQQTRYSTRTETDSTPPIEDNQEASKTSPNDTLAGAMIDTTELKGKRQWILHHFLMEHGTTSPTYDTLMDLNYDGNKDYVIGYYGKSGTGLKNRADIYFFNAKNYCYILNQQLSELYNPTFYTQQKKITWFYIANGGGEGGSLEWINNAWITTKEFSVVNEGDNSKWEISYPLRNKVTIKKSPYQMIPPGEILETNIKY